VRRRAELSSRLGHSGEGVGVNVHAAVEHLPGSARESPIARRTVQAALALSVAYTRQECYFGENCYVDSLVTSFWTAGLEGL
jgi:hypothetical protein